MGSRSVIQRRRAARSLLRAVFAQAESTWVVHYSCESFYDRDDAGSPRTTSIALRNLSNGQTHSFSVLQIAEELGIDATDIESRYEEVETELLQRYFAFLGQRVGHYWLHWNMRDINYGFAALEHRARVLKLEPVVVDDAKKVDLARLLIDLFSPRYAGHPRLASILEINHIGTKDFLSGKEEAEAFSNGQYYRLHLSTLRKVDVIAALAEKTETGTLETRANFWERNGRSVVASIETFTESWIIRALGVITLFAGLVRIGLWIWSAVAGPGEATP